MNQMTSCILKPLAYGLWRSLTWWQLSKPNTQSLPLHVKWKKIDSRSGYAARVVAAVNSSGHHRCRGVMVQMCGSHGQEQEDTSHTWLKRLPVCKMTSKVSGGARAMKLLKELMMTGYCDHYHKSWTHFAGTFTLPSEENLSFKKNTSLFLKDRVVVSTFQNDSCECFADLAP